MYRVSVQIFTVFSCGVWLFFFTQRASFLIPIIWFFGLEPQPFLLNGTLVYVHLCTKSSKKVGNLVTANKNTNEPKVDRRNAGQSWMKNPEIALIDCQEETSKSCMKALVKGKSRYVCVFYYIQEVDSRRMQILHVTNAKPNKFEKYVLRRNVDVPTFRYLKCGRVPPSCSKKSFIQLIMLEIAIN